MEFRPILSAMLRNKTGAFLVGLQIALTLAVIANAVFIIMQRMEKIDRPPGFDSKNLIFAQSYGFGPSYDQADTIQRDLDLLRSIPGVTSASSISGIPMSGGGRSSTFGLTPDPLKQQTNANTYDVDENIIESLGLKLVDGRTFTKQEIQFNPNPSNSDFVPAIIITQEVA
jgi:putative ABC transport system permease protein